MTQAKLQSQFSASKWLLHHLVNYWHMDTCKVEFSEEAKTRCLSAMLPNNNNLKKQQQLQQKTQQSNCKKIAVLSASDEMWLVIQ